jgi:hypothetical protein
VKRVRKDTLPSWADGRPQVVIDKLQDRYERAETDLQHGKVPIAVPGADDGVFMVSKSEQTLNSMYQKANNLHKVSCHGELDRGAFLSSLGESGLSYQVDIPKGCCTCPDATLNKMVCKHMFIVCQSQNNPWTFDHLPNSLKQHPHLIIDMSVCQTVGCPTTV